VTPDGECILVGFANGSVRLYEMDSKVSSDRYGYLLGHLDEATGTTPNGSNSTSHHNASDGMSTNAMTLRLKITSDGRYVFVGTRTGLRAIMSIHLQHYRHGKEDTNTQGEDDEEDDDGQDIKKHYHMDAKLRGFADVTKSSVYYQGRNRNAYYLLFGLGVGTLRMWRFIETHRGPVWEHLYGVSAGGNTLSWASFVYNHNKKMIEGIMSICYDKNLRVWQVKEEENHDEKEKKEATKRLIIKGHKDVPHCKEIVDVQGNFAYGITMGGDLYRIQLSTSASCTATTLGKRQQFELEVLVDTTTTSNSTTTIASMNSSSVNGGSNSGRRSGRSNAATGGKSLIENCYATSDGRSVIAVSTDGVFYSYNTTEKHSDEMSDILWMKIIGRLGGCSWSGSNGSKSPPVYLYEPIDTMTTTSKHGQAMMAVVSNAAHGAGNGFFTVDSIQAYAQRWDQKRENVEKNQTDFDHLLVANWPDPVKSQRYREYQRLKIQGVLNECWNCSARDVLHWEKNTSTTSSMKSTSSSSSSSTKHKGKNITTTTTSSRSSSNDGGSSSKQKVIAPCEVGVMKSSSISGTSPSPISMTNTTKSLKPTPSPSPSPSNHQRKNNNSRQEQIQKHKRPQSQANSNTNTNTNTNTTTLSASPPLTMIKMSSKHKKQRIIQDDEDEDEDEDNDNDNDDVDTETDTDADKENDTLLLLQVRIKQLEQEVDRYKERYDRIETEWQRRLNAERQLRRLWKKREAQYQEQIHSSQIQMNQLQKKLDQETEKKFALEKIEKLQLDQQNSVKSRYEKLCILTQEKIVEIEKQQKNMEQTSQILLKEVDRQVQSLKNWSGNEKNECIICKEEEAVMAIIPCGHLCFCEQDALKYQRQMQQKQFAKCPICEIELISFLRIY
jgi:hypothetical protein